MPESSQKRALLLQRRMAEKKADYVILSDPDTIYYMSGFWGYMGMELGRPTIVVVPASGSFALITPTMETDMARAMTWIEDIRGWIDGIGEEWKKHVRDLLGSAEKITIGIEQSQIHPVILEGLRREAPEATFVDFSDVVAEMRMIKSPQEIEVMRQAGQVAVAMCEAGVHAIGEGVPEYEVALAVIKGGTRKAAEFLRLEGRGGRHSPMIYNLQALQSGKDTSIVHRRPTVRAIQKGDPVYMCFCGIANFKQFKLGFDREYFVGTVKDDHARIYEVAIGAQQAALDVIRPGVTAEEVHKAANEVYQKAGFGSTYRTGRGIGYSILESPQLKEGDKTPLQPGMTFAVDGGVTVPGQFGARVGDSVVVTEGGYESLTPYPKDLRIL
ncbi:MAG: M24 family metallopeptidase [Proteobacteria bacterium]|nr:M24 family metallopeptidase [Pseudomonadota bacterium]